MGVLTDIVVAERADAQKVCDSAYPSKELGGMEAKGIDTVKLATLHAILVGGEFDPGFMGNLAATGGEEGPWVVEVEADLVQKLAKLDAGQLDAIAGKWAATEEFSPEYGDWPDKVVRSILGDLADLCRKANEQGKVVFMWMCL